MNGTTSPGEASTVVDSAPLPGVEDTAVGADGPQSAAADTAAPQEVLSGSPKDTIEAEGAELPDAPPPASTGGTTGTNGEEDANSEAETVLTSPVKRREAERQYSEAVKSEKAEEPALPSLPVAGQQEDDEDDEEADAPGSPDDCMATEETATAAKPAQNESDGDDSEPLSDFRSDSSSSDQSSRESSRSRAHSERPGPARNGADIANPMKRKHRASSVSWPNKRPSMDVPRRRLRGLQSEGGIGKDLGDRSMSPKGRSHRRAVSTQSALGDGAAAELHNKQKRRANTQFPVRDPKVSRNNWDESSISSEATSHGKGETKRPQRGIGRSTSTPGRPSGQKRHLNKYGFTKLAEACENNDLNSVKEWLERDPEQLEIAEFAHNTPLQIASLNGNDVIVKFLIDQGCKVDCANVDKDTPLIDAAENGHLEVVQILLEAGVDPLRENRKGQQALDVVDDEKDNGPEIKATLRDAVAKWNSDDAKQRREAEEEQRYRAGPAKELHFMARTYENLLKLVTNNDRNSVREFLDARVPVDNALIAAAARTGDSYLVSMLLAEITEKKAHQKPEKPMLAVLGSSHMEMVRSLTELEYFNPLWKNRQGKGWPEIAEDRHGPNWKMEVELLQRLHDNTARNLQRRSSSPVTRRDQGARRPPSRSGENSDGEDDLPIATKTQQRKSGGRRLMSRRDIRAASGKPLSDSSEEDSSDGEKAGEKAGEMMPPKSPGAKRASGRPRGNSGAGNEGGGETKARRSSVSLKKSDGLPSVDEKMEDAEAEDVSAQGQGQPEAPDKVSMPNEVSEEWDLEAEKRKEEARRQEDEARKAEEARVAKGAAKREEERAAEEARQLDATRREEQEAAKKTEDARKLAEDLKKQKTALAETARSNHRQGLLDLLPIALSGPLRLAHDNLSEDAECPLARAFEAFTPLQAIMLPGSDNDADSAKELFVLNAQVAPLLGTLGLELLLPHDAPGFESSLLSTWMTHLFSAEQRHLLLHALPAVSLLDPDSLDAVTDADSTRMDTDDDTEDDGPSFEAELALTHARLSAARTAQEKLHAASIKLRWVRLQDALKCVHPLLAEAKISVRMDMPVKRIGVAKEGTEFFEALKARCGFDGWFAGGQRVWAHGKLNELEQVEEGETIVRVRHDK